MGSLVKGVAGIGLPLVAIPILTFAMDVRDATPMIVGPAIITNVFQVIKTRQARLRYKEITPIIFGLLIGTFGGALIAVSVNPNVMVGILGFVILAFVAFSFSGYMPSIPKKGRLQMGFAAGTGTGLIGGMTGVFGPVLAIYTLALKMPKDAFVWAMGVLLLLASSGLGIFYATLGAFPIWVLIASFGAMLPSYIGIVAGTRLRKIVSEKLFRNVVLSILGIIALKHVASAFGLI